MAKELIGKQLIINFDDKNNFNNGILTYRVKTDGVLTRYQKSISIKNMAFSKLDLAKIIEKVIKKTKEEEVIDG